MFLAQCNSLDNIFGMASLDNSLASYYCAIPSARNFLVQIHWQRKFTLTGIYVPFLSLFHLWPLTSFCFMALCIMPLRCRFAVWMSFQSIATLAIAIASKQPKGAKNVITCKRRFHSAIIKNRDVNKPAYASECLIESIHAELREFSKSLRPQNNLWV